MIPKVVASEMGKAQTNTACCVGVVGLSDNGDKRLKVSKMVWESQPERVRAPYAKTERLQAENLSTTGHANPVGI
jgi:hypothetical protein